MCEKIAGLVKEFIFLLKEAENNFNFEGWTGEINNYSLAAWTSANVMLALYLFIVSGFRFWFVPICLVIEIIIFYRVSKTKF